MEVPVLALHDVPVLNLPDGLQANGISTTSRPARSETPEITASRVHEALPHEAWGRSEEYRLPESSVRVAVAQTKYLGWAESTRPMTPLAGDLKDPAGTISRTDSGPQSTSAQAASPSPAIPPLTIVGGVNFPTPNNTLPTPSDTRPDLSPAEQLSRAFVAQAAIVSHEGRSDFHLRLQPPQLGNVQIHLTATDHTISARVVVAQEGTQQLIESQAYQLRQSLAESGLVLGSFDVRRDGGGSSQGGRHQPPELSQPPSLRPVSPSGTAIVRASRSVPADGIDILA